MNRRIQTLLTPAPKDKFIFTVKTDNAGTSTSTQFTMPTSSTGTYNCQVNWGDGTSSIITTYNDAAWTHTYGGGAGTYTISISGTFVGIVFNNGGDKLKLLNISQWGTNFRIGTNQNSHFYGCTNLTITAIDRLNLTGTVSMNALFRGCTSITTIPGINRWNTSAVTNMQSVFNGCTQFNQDLSNWNTAAVTTMNSTFFGASVFNQSLNTWNVSQVTTFTSMFQNASAFNGNITSWNTASATAMTGMFNGANAFNQNISGWNTGNVTSMASMFANTAAFNQPIGTWNTAKVTSMNSMFSSANVFSQDISGWSIAALTTATVMLVNRVLGDANYSLLLDSVTGWPSQATIQTGVVFSGGSNHYSGANAISGRAVLTGTKGWTITDGGTP